MTGAKRYGPGFEQRRKIKARLAGLGASLEKPVESKLWGFSRGLYLPFNTAVPHIHPLLVRKPQIFSPRTDTESVGEQGWPFPLG